MVVRQNLAIASDMHLRGAFTLSHLVKQVDFDPIGIAPS